MMSKKITIYYHSNDITTNDITKDNYIHHHSNDINTNNYIHYYLYLLSYSQKNLLIFSFFNSSF